MRGKISPAVKQKAVMEIESGRLSQSEVARRLCVDGETVRSWPTAYRSEGNAGLECDGKNRIYSVQTKQQSERSGSTKPRQFGGRYLPCRSKRRYLQ